MKVRSRRSWTLSAMVSGSIGLSWLIWLGSANAAQLDDTTPAPLEFVGDQPLSVEIAEPPAGGTTTGVAHVFLRNSTATSLIVSFGLLARDADDAKVDIDAPTGGGEIGPYAVSPFDVTITKKIAKGTLIGFLVAMAKDSTSSAGAAENSVPPATLAITLAPPVGTSQSPAFGIVVGSLLAGLIGAAIVVVCLFVTGNGAALRDRMGPAEFKLSDSWASTLAGAGGLVTAFAGGTGFVTETPTLLSKEQFAGLGLLFGGLVIVAAFFYQTFTTTKEVNGKVQEQGFVLTFLIAGAAAIAAVIGQSATLVALFVDSSRISGGGSVANSLILLAGGAAVIAMIYGIAQMWRKVRFRTYAEPAGNRVARVPADVLDAALRTPWSLL